MEDGERVLEPGLPAVKRLWGEVGLRTPRDRRTDCVREPAEAPGTQPGPQEAPGQLGLCRAPSQCDLGNSKAVRKTGKVATPILGVQKLTSTLWQKQKQTARKLGAFLGLNTRVHGEVLLETHPASHQNPTELRAPKGSRIWQEPTSCS